ncbi:hypothetical protein RZS08_10800, partial [Arthrospira platensis SPKY1]|nr:hypothetical protein [Arthrospira platensis SPKY1]
GAALAHRGGAGEPRNVDGAWKQCIGFDCIETDLARSQLELVDARGLDLGRRLWLLRFRRGGDRGWWPGLLRRRGYSGRLRWRRCGGPLFLALDHVPDGAGADQQAKEGLCRTEGARLSLRGWSAVCRRGLRVKRLEVFRIHDAATRTFVIRGGINLLAYVAALWAGCAHRLCGK